MQAIFGSVKQIYLNEGCYDMFLWDLDYFLLSGFLEGVHFKQNKLFVVVIEG